jgi:pimeloyl-ACP methyl ester carboxylesterase
MTDLHQLSTSHGTIVVEETGSGDLPVLLIHGNSLSREVFRKQLGGALSKRYHLVAFDLPGHGDSSDALSAFRTYTGPSLADAAIEVLDLLGLGEVVVVGWSLGGHIALEMASQFSGIKGLLIIGAPPVSRHDMAEGFIATPHMRLAGQQYFGPSEIDAFGEAIFGAPIPVAFRRAIERADGLARKTILEAARSGLGIDQRRLVENLAVPLAVVNGAQDPRRAFLTSCLDDSSTMSVHDDLRRLSTSRSRRPRGFTPIVIRRYTISLGEVIKCEELFSL